MEIEELATNSITIPIDNKKIDKKIRKCICLKCRNEALRENIDLNNLERGYSERASLIDVLVQCEHENYLTNIKDNLPKSSNFKCMKHLNSPNCNGNVNKIFDHELYLMSEPFNIMEENPDGFLFIDE